MSTFRKIKSIHTAPEVQMGEVTLRQAFPVQGLEQISPFILLHHFDYTKGPGEHDFHVPPHPHRGFSPVTFIFEGAVHHRDSTGNDQEIGHDEVQWINAGRGIIHAEKVGRSFAEKGGRFQGIQLWINTPKVRKMDPPSYQAVTRDEIVLFKNGGAEFRLVSGTYDGKKGPANSDVLTGMMRMERASSFTFSFNPADNAALYVLEGAVRINGNQIGVENEIIGFERSEGDVVVEATKDSKLLVLSGTPINEPMVSYGPFVMNTQTEILEAMRDYRENKMGFLY